MDSIKDAWGFSGKTSIILSGSFSVETLTGVTPSWKTELNRSIPTIEDGISKGLQHHHKTCCEKGGHYERRACIVQKWYHYGDVISRQVGLCITNSNISKFMLSLGKHITNINKILKNLKFNIIADFVCSDYHSLIITMSYASPPVWKITSLQWYHLQIIQAHLPWQPSFSQHVLWWCYNHPDIPSSTAGILLFNSVFHDRVIPVSVSTLKLPLRVIEVLPLKPQASFILSICI